MLVGVQEMTYVEAAHVCGVTVGTLKARVSRARAQIMDYMQTDSRGGG